MRLINADDFIEKLAHVPMVQDAIKKAMDTMPTVEAIPIEWMLKWDVTLTDESMEIGSTVNWNPVKWMILEWRKSNG